MKARYGRWPRLSWMVGQSQSLVVLAAPSECGTWSLASALERWDRQRVSADIQAARADPEVDAQLLVHHLLTDFSDILPGNPRLIIRVASAWAMLRAVARSLELEVDAEAANEILVRAAVIWVRFPVLVDDLLDADEPPIIDPDDPACSPRWRRRDV